MRLLSITITACSLVAGLASQESYWVAASGGAQRLHASGAVQPGSLVTSSRDVKVAPDGKVWLVAAGLTILNPDGTLFTTVTAPLVTPYGIAFDQNGHAWVSGGIGVEEFDANGASLGATTLPATAPLGITVDAQGNKWIAHRSNTPPGSISRIDGITGAVTNHALPASSLILPIHVHADARGPLQPSHIWVVGDNRGAGELVEFDAAGNHLNTYVLSAAGRFHWMSDEIDATGVATNMLVGDWGTGDLFRVDVSTGAITNFPQGVGVRGVTFDGFGRLWLTLPSGPTTGLLRRLDPATMTPEVEVVLGASTQISTRRQFATTIDPLDDLDGDGPSNIGEILAGSSPFDAQSTPSRSVNITGPTNIGTTCAVSVLYPASVQMTVLLSFDTVSPGLPIPGFTGDLFLNLATLLPVSLNFGSSGSLPLTIPNNLALIGGTLYFQGIDALSLTFTNATGMLIW